MLTPTRCEMVQAAKSPHSHAFQEFGHRLVQRVTTYSEGLGSPARCIMISGETPHGRRPLQTAIQQGVVPPPPVLRAVRPLGARFACIIEGNRVTAANPPIVNVTSKARGVPDPKRVRQGCERGRVAPGGKLFQSGTKWALGNMFSCPPPCGSGGMLTAPGGGWGGGSGGVGVGWGVKAGTRCHRREQSMQSWKVSAGWSVAFLWLGRIPYLLEPGLQVW